MDFIFGLPSDRAGNTGIFTLVDRASKYLIALPVKASITAEQSARLFIDNVYCHFGLPSSIVSDRDPRFTSHFWRALFALCGTTLYMSSSDHPESDGQTERANRVLEDILRSYALSRPKTWSSMLPTACFAYNTSVHASTGFTSFYAVHLKHPRLPSDVDRPVLSVGGISDDIPRRTAASVEHFASSRESVLLRLRENIASAQAKQAREANKHNRGNTNVYSVNDLVYLHRSAVKGTGGSSKLRNPWLGPFPIRKVISPVDYELELPDDWDIHPVIYTGKLKRHVPQEEVTPSTPQTESSPAGSLSGEPEDARSRGLSPPKVAQQDARVPSTSCRNHRADDPSRLPKTSSCRRSPRFLQKASSPQESAPANRDASNAQHGAPLEGLEDDLQTPVRSGHIGGAAPQLHHAGDTDRPPSHISRESDFSPPLGADASLPAESSASEIEEHVGGAQIVAQRWGQYGREYRLETRSLEEAPTSKWLLVRDSDRSDGLGSEAYLQATALTRKINNTLLELC
ncbi:hypothetical protein AeRB84_015118, partial [Aphanomyces euteiches]